MNVLFSPHCDDEALFGAYTIIDNHPKVVIVFRSTGDYGDTEQRIAESREACAILGSRDVSGLKLDPEKTDVIALAEVMREIDRKEKPERVWAPDPVASHWDHVKVARAAEKVFGPRLWTYHTYDHTDFAGKVRQGREVRPEPEWVLRKLRALACYRSQILHPRANQFFLEDLREYQGA